MPVQQQQKEEKEEQEEEAGSDCWSSLLLGPCQVKILYLIAVPAAGHKQAMDMERNGCTLPFSFSLSVSLLACCLFCEFN